VAPNHKSAVIDPHELEGQPDAVSELIDRRLWPVGAGEYGRQLARPGLILAGLAALRLGAGVVARRGRPRTPRVLGVVEPLKVRRRKARRQLWRRLRRR
jgi:hypothetical protein